MAPRLRVPLLASLIVACAALGCAPTLPTLSSDYTLGTKDETIVVGRFEFVRADGSRFFGESLSTMYFTVRNEATGKRYRVKCDTAGLRSDFYVALPAGTYTLREWDTGGAIPEPSGQFRAGPGQIAYVGTLRFTKDESFESRWAAALGGKIPGRYSLADETEQVSRRFRERFPHIKQGFVKALWSPP